MGMCERTRAASRNKKRLLNLPGRPVYSLILGTDIMIVLSSDKAVKDLLDKRSNIYSSRTELYLGNLVSGYLRVLLMVCFFQTGCSTLLVL